MKTITIQKSIQQQKPLLRIITSPKAILKQSRLVSISTSIPLIKFPSFPIIPLKLRTPRASKISGGLFGVAIRRFGTFRTIGKGLSLKRAISIGRGRVATTLGATFKIIPQGKGVAQNIPTPKGFKRKKGLIFIEAPRFRLSRRGEVQEIQIARRLKV